MTPAQDTAMSRVLEEVREERLAQHARFGEQNLPDGTGGIVARKRADAARFGCDAAIKGGTLTYRALLREEFLEALAERDPVKLRAELVQVAAVAVQWIEAIDRRKP